MVNDGFVELMIQQSSEKGEQLHILQQQLLQTQQKLQLTQEQVRECACILGVCVYGLQMSFITECTDGGKGGGFAG